MAVTFTSWYGWLECTYACGVEEERLQGHQLVNVCTRRFRGNGRGRECGCSDIRDPQRQEQMFGVRSLLVTVHVLICRAIGRPTGC